MNEISIEDILEVFPDVSIKRYDFYKDIYSNGTIEINDLRTVFNVPVDQIDNFLSVAIDSNVYFVGGIWELKKRASDKDIIKKNYFAIDIDLRKIAKDLYRIEISDSEIIHWGETVCDYLKDEFPETFWKIRYCVFSWNGLHLYYFRESPVEIIGDWNPSIWAEWLNNVFEEFLTLMWDSCAPDFACKNIGRILRLPGSVNQKTKKTTKVIWFNDVYATIFFDSIQVRWLTLLKAKREDLERQSESLKRELELKKKLYPKMNIELWNLQDLFVKINWINAAEVSMKIFPQFQLDKNGKNFLSWKKDGNAYKWFYYIEEINAICNGGSHEYNWGDANSCWSSSVLVKNHFWFSWGETIKWFKENFNM